MRAGSVRRRGHAVTRVVGGGAPQPSFSKTDFIAGVPGCDNRPFDLRAVVISRWRESALSADPALYGVITLNREELVVVLVVDGVVERAGEHRLHESDEVIVAWARRFPMKRSICRNQRLFCD